MRALDACIDWQGLEAPPSRSGVADVGQIATHFRTVGQRVYEESSPELRRIAQAARAADAAAQQKVAIAHEQSNAAKTRVAELAAQLAQLATKVELVAPAVGTASCSLSSVDKTPSSIAGAGGELPNARVQAGEADAEQVEPSPAGAAAMVGVTSSLLDAEQAPPLKAILSEAEAAASQLLVEASQLTTTASATKKAADESEQALSDARAQSQRSARFRRSSDLIPASLPEVLVALIKG